MNYITACPKCGTQFLLSTEHLKAHRGKVQCGHCEHVFNAKNRLTEISDDIQTPEEYQESLEQADSATIAKADDIQDKEPERPLIEAIEIIEDSTYIGEFNPSITKPIVIEDLTTDPKFSRKKIKLNIWYSLASVLLLITAATQVIYFKRTEIAAQFPQIKPFLVNTCHLLNCEVDLPENLDLFVLDDSDMQEDETYLDVINFSSSLINKAGYAQAYPSIELTLTNTDDKPVLRKRVSPTEYLADAETKISNGIAAHEEIRIKLAIHPSNVAVAGYRILLVY